MDLRRLTALALGLALPIALVAPASADFGDDVRGSVGERVDAELADIDDDTIECSFCEIEDEDDGDDGASFDVVGYEDFSGIDDDVRESVSGIGDEVRDDVLEGSDG